jgi:hypothetical protein
VGFAGFPHDDKPDFQELNPFGANISQSVHVAMERSFASRATGGPKMESVPSWLVLIALVFFAPFIALPTRPKFLILFIWPAWLCAYMVVPAKIYKNKLPIPAFGRWVEYEQRRVFYKLLFVVMLLVGAFVELAAFAIQASRSVM